MAMTKEEKAVRAAEKKRALERAGAAELAELAETERKARGDTDGDITASCTGILKGPDPYDDMVMGRLGSSVKIASDIDRGVIPSSAGTAFSSIEDSMWGAPLKAPKPEIRIRSSTDLHIEDGAKVFFGEVDITPALKKMAADARAKGPKILDGDSDMVRSGVTKDIIVKIVDECEKRMKEYAMEAVNKVLDDWIEANGGAAKIDTELLDEFCCFAAAIKDELKCFMD